MSKKTRKGIKIGIPLIEGWYEQEIEEIRKDIRGRSKKSLFRRLFGRSKDDEYLKKRFLDFLTIAEKDIELHLWEAKGNAIKKELGKEIDYEFHRLFSLLISIFNKIEVNFDPKDLSEDLLNHLKRELELLQTQSGYLWNVESHDSTPQGKQRAEKLVSTFRRNLWDFGKRMKPFLRQEENETEE